MRKSSEATRHRFEVERRDWDESWHEPPRPRAVRNGLPMFRPYVYRGTGADQLAKHSPGPKPRVKP